MTNPNPAPRIAIGLLPLMDVRHREAFKLVAGPSLEEADKETVSSMLKVVTDLKRDYVQYGNGLTLHPAVVAAEMYVNIGYAPEFGAP